LGIVKISEWWLESYLPDGGETFIDVGANRGEWSAALAPRFRRGYAIEPNPDLLPVLMETLPANVHVLLVGAWSYARYMDFAKYERDVHLSAVFLDGGIGTGTAIGRRSLFCQPLDRMPIEGRVDFVKVDVEGAEVEALRGARAMIEHDRPHMIIEVHHQESQVCDMMEGWGYQLSVVRHPDYDEGGELWNRHFWLVCDPL